MTWAWCQVPKLLFVAINRYFTFHTGKITNNTFEITIIYYSREKEGGRSKEQERERHKNRSLFCLILRIPANRLTNTSQRLALFRNPSLSHPFENSHTRSTSSSFSHSLLFRILHLRSAFCAEILESKRGPRGIRSKNTSIGIPNGEKGCRVNIV